MSDTVLTFHGVTSSELGFVCERVGPLPMAKRKMSVYSVPGRNGDYTITDDAYENVRISYDFYFKGRKSTNDGHRPEDNIVDLQNRIAFLTMWAYRFKGYQQLIDNNDPLYYREAYIDGGVDIENILRTFGRVTLTFNCKPQRFRRLDRYDADVHDLFGRIGFYSIRNNQEYSFRTSEPTNADDSFPLFLLFSSPNGATTIKTWYGTETEADATEYILLAHNGGVKIDCENKIVYKNITVSSLVSGLDGGEIGNELWYSTDFPHFVGWRDPPDGGYYYNKIKVRVSGVADGTAIGFISPRWWTL